VRDADDGGVIVLQTMMWPDEVRRPDFAGIDAGEARPAEVKMARMLVETLAGDFDPDEFEDDYREAVETLVRTKIEGGEVKRMAPEPKSGGEVVDLLAALQRSVDAARSARGEAPASASAEDDGDEGAGDGGEASSEGGAAKSPTARKSTAKKSTAKKAAAKKPAKKTAKKAAKKTDRKPARKAG